MNDLRIKGVDICYDDNTKELIFTHSFYDDLLCQINDRSYNEELRTLLLKNGFDPDYSNIIEFNASQARIYHVYTKEYEYIIAVYLVAAAAGVIVKGSTFKELVHLFQTL
jgi:hypothetical protein